MANELTIRASLSFEKGGTLAELLLGPITRDVAGTNALKNRQSIGFAAEEVLLVGDVASGGYFIAINRDATNYVKLRAGSGLTDLVRLKPGDFCLFRLDNAATLYAIADTAAVELEYGIVDL